MMQKLTRRHVLVTLSSTTVMLCPRILTAQELELDWTDVPTTAPIGEDTLLTLAAGPAEVDVSTLQPGEVAVIARPSDDADAHGNTEMTHYIAVMRRTDAQIAAANDRPGTVQDPNYLVVDLTCPHRGKAIGMTGDAAYPFACTDRRGRHSSVFDTSGNGVSGASADEFMTVPNYTLSGTVLTLT